MTKFFTTNEVAIELKITARRVRAIAKAIGASKHGSAWKFTLKDVLKMKTRNRLRGYPGHKTTLKRTKE